MVPLTRTFAAPARTSQEAGPFGVMATKTTTPTNLVLSRDEIADLLDALQGKLETVQSNTFDYELATGKTDARQHAHINRLWRLSSKLQAARETARPTTPGDYPLDLPAALALVAGGCEISVRPIDFLNPRCGFEAHVEGRDFKRSASGATPEAALHMLEEIVMPAAAAETGADV